MGNLSNFISLAAETISRYNRATSKPYQKIKHVMTKEVEILVPYDYESYTFRLTEGWKITYQNKQLIILEKKEID